MRTTQLITVLGWLLVATGVACAGEWYSAPVLFESPGQTSSPADLQAGHVWQPSSYFGPVSRGEVIQAAATGPAVRRLDRPPTALRESVIEDLRPVRLLPPEPTFPGRGARGDGRRGEFPLEAANFDSVVSTVDSPFPPPAAPFEEQSFPEDVAVGIFDSKIGSPSRLDDKVPSFSDEGPGNLLPNVEFPEGPELPQLSEIAARLGEWFVDSSGNPAKVGEYQSLQSSLFADVDGLITNGVRTWNFYGSVLDKDASKIGVNYFGQSISTRVDYERYLRRLDRDPLDSFVDFDQQPPLPLPAPPENFRDMKEDLAVGEDFAIRVEELDASMRGRLTSNVNWRLNVWAMRKHGERQATAMAHCFAAPNATDTNGNPVTGRACHVLSQRQRIDWTTTEIEPVFEGRFGPVTAEYSHTVRMLNTNDQLVTRPYDNFGIVGNQPYGLVPENTTQIDRLKLGVTLPERRDAYARLYSGNTENDFRDTNRRFRGLDLRFSDRSLDDVTFVGYVKKYIQTGQFPQFLVPFENTATIRLPINYDRTLAGLDATWRPFSEAWSWNSDLRLSCGYEYRELKRENATYTEQAVTVNESATQTNNFYLRAARRWSRLFDSSVGYRISFINDPLFAISTNATTNTSLPTQTHRLDFKNTWAPSPTFLLTGQFGVINGWNSSDVANFQENNYDLVFTTWYAPTPRWSVSAGMAFYSNWIDQDITLGTRSNPLTLPWEYGGRSDLINFGTTYAWTRRMTLSATVDFVNARNAFDPLSPWPDLPSYSDVQVETTRFTGGIDYAVGQNASCYLRYQAFDYADQAAFFDSGRAEMLLLGGTATF